LCCFIRGRAQIIRSNFSDNGSSGQAGRSDLHLVFASNTAIKPCTFKQQPCSFLAHPFNKFHVAANFGFEHVQLDFDRQPACSQSHQPTEPSLPHTARQQQFLPAGDPLGWLPFPAGLDPFRHPPSQRAIASSATSASWKEEGNVFPEIIVGWTTGVDEFCFDARPQPDLLPQEKEQLLSVSIFSADHPANPVARIS